MIEFIPKQIIEKIAEQDLLRYRNYTSEFHLNFPLDVKRIFQSIFGLQTDLVDLTAQGETGNQLPPTNNLATAPVEASANRVVGRLYPEKFFFQGKDKVILVNTGCVGMTEEFCRFAIAHMGGHYALHFNQGGAYKSMELIKSNFALSGPLVCNLSDQYHPLEIQANYYASAILMPRVEIFRLATSQKLINLYARSSELCQKFGVSQQILELRLQHLEANMQHAQRFYTAPASPEFLKSLEKLAP